MPFATFSLWPSIDYTGIHKSLGVSVSDISKRLDHVPAMRTFPSSLTICIKIQLSSTLPKHVQVRKQRKKLLYFLALCERFVILFISLAYLLPKFVDSLGWLSPSPPLPGAPSPSPRIEKNSFLFLRTYPFNQISHPRAYAHLWLCKLLNIPKYPYSFGSNTFTLLSPLTSHHLCTHTWLYPHTTWIYLYFNILISKYLNLNTRPECTHWQWCHVYLICGPPRSYFVISHSIREPSWNEKTSISSHLREPA